MGSGAGDFVLESTMPISGFDDLKEGVLELLKARDDKRAIELLLQYPFNLCAATNHFNDEFYVLHAYVPVALYEDARLHGTSVANRAAFSRIAKTFTEVGTYVRFIAVDLSQRSKRESKEKPGLAMPASPSLPLKVFLCHASGDKQAVRDLYDRLMTDGFLPWLDEKNLIAGQDWHHEIKNAVRASDVVVVCLSNGSVTKGGYVQKEIRLALDVEEEKPEGTIFIIPARLEEVKVPDRLTRWHWVNLFDRNGYDELIRALKSRHETAIQKPRSAPELQQRTAKNTNENELTEAMYNAYHESKKLKYNPARFFHMLSEKGALATAKSLLGGDIKDISEGFTALWNLNRLDLTVEAICLRPELRGLFSEKELSIARRRLEQVGYQIKSEPQVLVGLEDNGEKESLKIQNRDSSSEPFLPLQQPLAVLPKKKTVLIGEEDQVRFEQVRHLIKNIFGLEVIQAKTFAEMFGFVTRVKDVKLVLFTERFQSEEGIPLSALFERFAGARRAIGWSGLVGFLSENELPPQDCEECDLFLPFPHSDETWHSFVIGLSTIFPIRQQVLPNSGL